MNKRDRKSICHANKLLTPIRELQIERVYDVEINLENLPVLKKHSNTWYKMRNEIRHKLKRQKKCDSTSIEIEIYISWGCMELRK